MKLDSSSTSSVGFGSRVRTFFKSADLRNLMVIAAGSALAACTGGVSPGPATTQQSTYYSIGGTVTGLTGSGLILQDNNGDNLPVSAAGSFVFNTQLTRGNSYSVSVKAQPSAPIQTCVVTNGAGTVTGDNVTNVTVMCADKTTPTDAIGGSVSGLVGSGLVLQDNGGDNLAVAANGAFTFATGLPSGTPFAVTVLTPPMNPFQNCAVANGTGTTNGADVNNISISCKTNSSPAFTIGGTISGVASSGSITLQDDGTDNLTISADGTFTFKTPIPTGSAYSVTALSSPTSQTRTCAFTNASGVVANANVTNVSVVCAESAPVVNINVNVSGLTGTGLVLQDNGADNLAISGNGSATFATGLASGTSYNVTVLTQPTAQTCTVANATGTASSAAAPLAVNCVADAYPISATVQGLNAGAQLILDDNGADALTIGGNGTFVFATPIVYNGNYLVTVGTQPVGEVCTVSNGAGSGVTAVVTVNVLCSIDTFSVAAAVSGLSAGAQLILDDNGGNPLTVTANGTYAFSTPVAFNGSYAVTVATQPVGETCTVSNATGAGVTGNVAVGVICAVRTFTVSATVGGLASGKQVTLNDNGGDPLTVAANSTSMFATRIAYNASYAVTVGTQPVGQTCTVANGSGAGVTANVTVTVTCSTNTYTVSAAVMGLTSGNQVTLDNNGGNPLTFTTNTTAAFTTPVVYNGTYAVTVGTQPTGQTCTAINGSGAGVTANVTVNVTCSTNTYTISAAVSGLTAGKQVTLNNNGGNPLTVTTNATAAFTTPVAYNGAYAVTVGTQPTGQTCTVANGSGTGVTANVTVAVTCATNNYSISAAVSGLAAGKQVTLDNNGADPLTVTANGTYAFTTPVAYNGSYAVTVGTQPVGETCTANNGSGTNVTAPVTVTVTCATTTYPISATVTGLANGLQVTLDDNVNDALTFTSNTTATFGTQIAYNGSYSVTVGTQPTGQTCTVANPSGTNVTAAVTVNVSCVATTYSLTVNVAGLTSGQQVTAAIDGPNNTTFTTNGSNVYAGAIAYNGSYSVTIVTQPTQETCVAANGSGSGVTADVTVTVSCAVNYTVGGSVSGLFAEPLVLQLNGANNLNVYAESSSFVFPTGLPSGTAYTVSVFSQASGYYCTLTNNTGTIANANVTSVVVTCAPSNPVVTLFAGSSLGQFGPTNLVQDDNNNVFIVDFLENEIREIDSNGIASVIAGSPLAGAADGVGAAASFNGPTGISLDTDGSLFIADSNNNEIRHIVQSTDPASGAPIWTVTTIAGSTTAGSADGSGTAAQFNGPTGLLGGATQLFVVDQKNNEIRLVSQNGPGAWTVQTIAGSTTAGSADGYSTAASFNLPAQIAFVDGGIGATYYITDQHNNEIRAMQLDPARGIYVVSTVAGTTIAGDAEGTGPAASFNQPIGIAAGAGCTASGGCTDLIFVSDALNNSIRQVQVSETAVEESESFDVGVVSSLAGSDDGSAGFVDGLGSGALFNAPLGVTYCCGTNGVFVSDYANEAVREVTTDGNTPGTTTTLYSSFGTTDGTGTDARLHDPTGLAVDGNGNVYVADTLNNEIRMITPAGAVTTLAGNPTAGNTDGTGAAASFSQPEGVAVDANGNIYVADFINNEIRKITAGGVVSTLAGNPTPGSANGTGAAASFNGPYAVAVDPSGNVFVADKGNNEIRKITPAGVVSTFAGSTTAGSADGTGAAAGFNGPLGVAADSSGNVYVADSGNNEIRMITPVGVVSTLAGSTAPGNSNGTGTAAHFNGPDGIAVDAPGNLYVADFQNNAIRMIAPGGVVSTLAGTSSPGDLNGAVAQATFNGPIGIAVNSLSEVYVGDTANNQIRKIAQLNQ